MKIKIGDYELLDSVTVIGIEDQPIEIQLKGNENAEEVGITYVFCFIKDENNKESRIEYKSDSTTKGFINFVNIKNYNGGGNIEIVRIGTYKGRELYYSVRIYTLDKASNTIMVNFYVGKEVDSGQ